MIQITPVPSAVSQVRHAAASLLTSWGLAGICEDAVLCLSEAVTNSVLHAPPSGTVTIAIERDRGRIRIEVCDGNRSCAEEPVPDAGSVPGTPADAGTGPQPDDAAPPRRGPHPEYEPVTCLEDEPKEHGWGLEIIAAVADRWGMDAGLGGRRVWFEKDLPGPAHPVVMP